ncbi:hypothetical protein [Aeromicrobium sp. UC242_57]|uniref:hypothetical protein n=1 Tax=Aeromicrobium sp. UC242_57 TaxID=3374624 RepID=UPI0037ABDCCB
MKMNKKKAIIAAGAAAAATMLIAPAAFASGVVIVNGTSSPAADVPVTGALSGTISFLTDFGTPASCTTASVGGYVKRGASLASGTKVGAITTMTFGGGTACTATGLNYPVVIEKSTKVGSPAEWPIHLTATPAKGSASAPIEIRNVDAQMHSTGSPVWACAGCEGHRPGHDHPGC